MDQSPFPAESSPKRRQIVHAAEELFLAHGYGQVSMEAIARKAGVSKATLYAHFAGKDALFACIINDKGLESPIDEVLFPAEVEDLRAALTTIGLRLLRFLLRGRTLAIMRVAVAESVRFPELGQAIHDNGPQRFHERFQPWLEGLARRGLMRPDDVPVASNHFMALLRGDLFLRGALGVRPAPAEAEVEATVRAAVETWLRAFATPPA